MSAPTTSTAIPAPHRGLLVRYRVMAWVTGVVLAVSALIGLSAWPWYVGEGPAGVLWTAHGWLYLLYVVTAFHLAYRWRWRPVRTLLVLLAGTVPFMSFVAERRVTADLRRRATPTGDPANHPKDHPADDPADPAPAPPA